MAKTIGILGATFDPPTLGHEDVIKQAFTVCDKIILVPSIRHGFFKKSLCYNVRIEMTKLFIHDLPEKLKQNIFLSNIEESLLKKSPCQPVYTYDVMHSLENKLKLEYQKEFELCFIRGTDNASFATWSKFYRYRDIENRWRLFTAEQRIDIRSTTVRNILKQPISVQKKQQLIREYVPDKLNDYIMINALYF